jgi:hypothetical protein
MTQLVRVLLPPYAGFGLHPGMDLPLGAIVVCNASENDAALLRAAVYETLAPWAPLALILPENMLEPSVLEAVTRLRGKSAYVAHAAGGIAPATICAAVAARARPTANDVANYVARRLENRECGRLVLAALERPEVTGCYPGGGRYRTLCRRLRQLGPLTPREWRLLWHLAGLPRSTEPSVEALACAAGVEARALRHQVSRLMGLPLHEYRIRVGWEWTIEATLREHRYQLAIQAPQQHFSA